MKPLIVKGTLYITGYFSPEILESLFDEISKQILARIGIICIMEARLATMYFVDAEKDYAIMNMSATQMIHNVNDILIDDKIGKSTDKEASNSKITVTDDAPVVKTRNRPILCLSLMNMPGFSEKETFNVSSIRKIEKDLRKIILLKKILICTA